MEDREKMAAITENTLANRNFRAPIKEGNMFLVAFGFAVCLSLIPALSRAVEQPIVTPDAAVMTLNDMGFYVVGYAYRGQAEQQFPLGWSGPFGSFDARTGVACEQSGTQNGKQAFLLHCPWRNGTGITFQQFDFLLPTNTTSILFTGATALRSDAVGKSDGVTFRIFANGVKLLELNQTNDIWQPFQFDFSSLAGSNLLLRFEVDPGPSNNASFDYSLWGDRILTLDGYNPIPITHPTPAPLAISNLWSVQTGDVAPCSGFDGSTYYQLSNNVARFHYTGADGWLEYVWQAPQSPNDGAFGTLTLNAQMTGDAPVSIPLANDTAISWTQTPVFQSAVLQSTNQGIALVQKFLVGTTSATVCVVGQILGKSLAMSVTCDQAFIQTFKPGGWGPVLRSQQMVVPYSPCVVNFLEQENMFASTILDWTASAASSQDSSMISYNTLTDGSRHYLQDRIVFSVAWHQAEVFPNNPNPPSPYLDYLANRVVLDIWGGSFTNIANTLTNLADYGITNCVAIVHDWQRSGYDNALPDHYPAQASLGGDPGMSNLVAAASSFGIAVALHENYADYYPNYDLYDTNDIALTSQGTLTLAWSNSTTQIQSFATKPNAILRLAATQSPEIHRRYGTTADYLDVHSSVAPWFHVDYRAGEQGAGMFSQVWNVHRQLWAYERATHAGPVLGEGKNHWYWSGCLDGVEAQIGSGGGFSVPLHVDFDLLKIHPLQFNHGMGYYNRWWPDNYETNWPVRRRW